MKQSIIFSSLFLILHGCGSKFTVSPDFVSNRNQCVPDYLGLAAPVLLDPEAIVLEKADSSGVYPYAQRFSVDRSGWYYSMQLRLNLPGLDAKLESDLFVNGDSPVAAYQALEASLPDGSTGELVASANSDTSILDKSETWVDLVFTVPQKLNADQTYWAMIRPQSDGIAWTTVQGNGFGRMTSGWDLSATRSATLRAVPCEDR